MSLIPDLKERREAIQLADLEFYRVKREKLCRERAKYGCSSDKELRRDAINRASAAASRAKLVYLARDLENRTDQLEYERNLSDERSKRLVKKMKQLQDERKMVHNVLRTLWEQKDATVCAILLESNIMHVLQSLDDEICETADPSSITPIRVSIPHTYSSGTRRSPAVDISGLPPSSPLNSTTTTTTETRKHPDYPLQYITALRGSLCDAHARARNVTSNGKLPTVHIQKKKAEHLGENLSSTQFKCRKKRTRRSQQQIQAFLAMDFREPRVPGPGQRYDPVRDIVRTQSNTSPI